MPELQESDDDSTTEPITIDDDDDWFDDVVPHDEQPPPPPQLYAATVGQGCSPSIGLPVTSPAGAATSGQECFPSIGLPLTPEAGSICQLCNKPRWCNTYNARFHNCRDFCLHANIVHDTTDLDSAPVFPTGQEPLPLNLLPVQHFSDTLHVNTKQPHREKEREKGSLSDHLINW